MKPAIASSGPPRGDGLELEFTDGFETGALDPARWIAAYLPHWSSRELSRPRYEFSNGNLVLRIDAEQKPWCPEFDGGVVVSSIQTGQFSGPVGSSIGQHRFRQGLVVREAQPEARLYLPQYGYIELRARADMGPANLVALFLIGFESQPDQSGEITVFEIFGKNATPTRARLGYGIKKINDPALRQEFFEEDLPFDVSDWHVYGAEWSPSGVDFYFDGRMLRRVAQSPHYPMQLMLNVYSLPETEAPALAAPAIFEIDYVRGYRRSHLGAAKSVAI
jgi:hypothetical protein